MNGPAAWVRDLERAYGARRAVQGLTFSVERGEIFGLLGPNGAGKTTTLQVLTTLLAPTGGEVRVAGFDVGREAKEVRRQIGIVFQEPSLDLRLTVRENLMFHARLYGMPARAAAACGESLLGLMELSSCADALAETLSGGMRRRLEVARALLHRPSVLFLDEPTAGLDPKARVRLWEHLQRLRRDEEMTILLCTHDMEEAERCDRVAIIDGGRIRACDTPEALKARLGGDVVRVDCADPEALVPALSALGARRIQAADGHLVCEHPEGAAFAAEIARRWPDGVRGVWARRPTLEDVFLAITGRGLHDDAEPSALPARRGGRS